MFKSSVGGYAYQPYFIDPKVNALGFNMFPTKDDRWYLPTAHAPGVVRATQGELLARTPMVEIIKIGDSEPELPPLVDPS
ncbi:MAG: hypothetical protein ACKO45_06780 [Cyanobium sp.]